MSLTGLEKHAEEIRKDLAVPKQNELFEAAAEAGWLAANADGTVDAEERKALVDAIGVLSKGVVIEWEVEELLDACAKRKDDKRSSAIGQRLAALGQPEAGVLFAAFVAQASGGIDKKESAVLHAIGKAAGLARNEVSAILKRVGAKAD